VRLSRQTPVNDYRIVAEFGKAATDNCTRWAAAEDADFKFGNHYRTAGFARTWRAPARAKDLPPLDEKSQLSDLAIDKIKRAPLTRHAPL
jgi:hypothetical protein